jgi:hypothetical protein
MRDSWRCPAKVVAVALANKTARAARAMMKTGEAYRAPKPAATRGRRGKIGRNNGVCEGEAR